MSDADDAFAAAEAEIETVRQSGGTELKLTGESFDALTRLPNSIGKLEKLETLRLGGILPGRATQVTDLTPLTGLTGLQSLDLDNTPVTDLAPLAGLTGLRTLDLRNAPTADLAPLAGLTGLLTLDLRNTRVTNLAPLAGLTRLQSLDLRDTRAADLTPLAGLTGLQSLYLNSTQVTDLAPLAGLTGLQSLDLSSTQVTDLAPLAGLTGLQSLDLIGTQVTDLAPLAGLTGLQYLFLSDTQVTDLAPLAGLTGLQSLDLNGTQVTDLTPLAGLPNLKILNLRATEVVDLRPLLQFARVTSLPETPGERLAVDVFNSAAAKADPNLPAEDNTIFEDDRKATPALLDYLRTLPRWPEPLDGTGKIDLPPRDDAPELEEPPIPVGLPAPLRVVEENGVLRPAMPGDGLDDQGRMLAEAGWEALRDYLADLADQRDRIGNSMPALGRALARLETALGDNYGALQPVAAGTHGNRVIRQSARAGEILMEADADDIAEFAAALALFLERFPEWRDYRAAAQARPPDPKAVEDALPELEEVADELEDRPEIDPGVPKKLDEQIETVEDDPADPVASKGLLDSAGNVLSALATAALPVLRWARAEAADVAKMTWAGVKKVMAGAAVTGLTGLTGAAFDIFVNKGAALHALAAQFPEQLGWLLKFLQAFGL